MHELWLSNRCSKMYMCGYYFQERSFLERTNCYICMLLCVCLWKVVGGCGCGRRKRGNLREGRRKERRKCEWRESEAAGTKIRRRPKEQGEPQQDSCTHLCIFPHPPSVNHRVLLPLTSDLKVLDILRQSVWNQITLIYHFRKSLEFSEPNIFIAIVYVKMGFWRMCVVSV